MTNDPAPRLEPGHKRDIIVACIGVVPGILATLGALFFSGALRPGTSGDISSHETELSGDLQTQKTRPFLGGVWINSQGKPKFVDQSGPDGESLVITEGGIVYPAEFDGFSSIRAAAPGEVLYANISDGGRTLIWTHAPGRPWKRGRSPGLACSISE